MNIWPFKKKAPTDRVAVQFASNHQVRAVQYDADGKPFVWIFGCIFRIDGNKGTNSYFGDADVVWLERSTNAKAGEPNG